MPNHTTAPQSALISADYSQQPLAILGRDLPHKQLCLTYDDGPGPQTLLIAEYLREHAITATFFVRGDRSEHQPEVLAEVVRLGHTLGNHAYSHPHLIELEPAAAIEEVRRTHELIAPLIHDDRLYLRPPYGSWRRGEYSVAEPLKTDPVLRRYVGPILWNIGGQGGNEGDRYSADWYCWEVSERHPKALTPYRCGEGYLREIEDKGRGIVLMHDHNDRGINDTNTLQMTQWLVPQLQQRGYRFVGLDAVPQIAALLRGRGGAG